MRVKRKSKVITILLVVMMVLGSFLSLMPIAYAAAPLCSGAVIQQMFDNAYSTGYSLNQTVATFSPVEAGVASSPYDGSVLQRVKIGVTTGNLQYANMVSSPTDYTAYKNNTAVQFLINPLISRSQYLAGVVCYNNGKYASLTIPLDYYTKWSGTYYGKWYRVIIPFQYLIDHGTFASNGSGLTAFDWTKFAGFSIAGSDESIAAETNWIYLDDVKVIRYIWQPSNITASAVDTAATFNWSAPVQGPAPSGYKIYDNTGALIADVTSGTTYTKTGLTPSSSYTYYIQAYNTTDGTASEPVFVIFNTGSTAGKSAPVINNIYPADGDNSYAVGSQLFFTANATANDGGTIQYQDFYIDGVVLNSANRGPGVDPWYGAKQGDHSVALLVRDNLGNSATKVINISVGNTGHTYRQYANSESFITSSTTHYLNMTNNATANAYDFYTAGGPAPASGFTGNMKFKCDNGVAFLNNRVYGLNNNYYNFSSGTGPIPGVALTFLAYVDVPPLTSNAYTQNLNIELLSSASGSGTSDIVECWLPLTKYITAIDYQKWVQVTIPFSDFATYGAFYTGSTPGTRILGTAANFTWSKIYGYGFNASTTGLGTTATSTDLYYNDMKVTVNNTFPTSFDVNSVDVTNGTNAAPVATISAAGANVGCNVKLTNNTGITKHAAVIFATYKGNTLDKVSVVDQNIGYGSTLIRSSNLSTSGVTKVEAFVWDGMATMKPISLGASIQ